MGVTLLDIERMSRQLGIAAREVFEQYTVYPGEGPLLMLVKDDKGSCPFLGERNLCGIHEAKPWTCRVYVCGDLTGTEVFSYASCYSDEAGRAQLWEMVVAKAETEVYLRRHGAHWDEEDFRAGVEAIQSRSIPSPTRQIRIARMDDGGTFALAFDCSGCDKRAQCCAEAAVTLDDLERISKRLECSVEELFMRVVASDPSNRVEGILAIKDPEIGHCAFLDAHARTCRIDAVRPLECRFMTCPISIGDPEKAERLYFSSGTLEEQFRHQMAVAVTRRYVRECGTGFNLGAFKRMMRLLERLVFDRAEFERFCRDIAAARHIDPAGFRTDT